MPKSRLGSEPRPGNKRLYSRIISESHEQELKELREIDPRVEGFFYGACCGWKLIYKSGFEIDELDSKEELVKFIIEHAKESDAKMCADELIKE